jgi:transposase
MSDHKSDLRLRIETAAELRASGSSWAQVAKRLRCRPATCRRWAQRYPDEWRRAYAAAVAERDAETEAESIFKLRELLRDENVKMQREAARDLLLRKRDSRSASAASPDNGEVQRLQDILGTNPEFEADSVADDIAPSSK